MAENSAFASVEERNLAVLGSRMAYVEAGKGVPVLFLHGNPTSSFIWRNVIPEVAPVARCIAPDLIGFGRSDKPDLEYGFADHVRYLDAFIDALGLERFVLVAQDWGTALAFHFAARRPAAVLGLAFMEFIRPFASWDEFHQRDAARALFKALRMPGEGESLVFEQNVFVERVLPGSILRQLSEEEMQAYRAPFLDPASRRPVLRFPRELPIEGEPKEVHELLEAAHATLRASSYPKLLFAAEPGALVSPAFAEEFVAGLENCRLVKLGAGAHYLQEDHAQVIGLAVAHWMAETGLSTEAGLLARAG
jgi:haloalkane dehalogenase